MDADTSPQPIRHREAVQDAWVDYNGHMNVAYYVLVFDHATDVLLDAIGLDAAGRDALGGSVFVVEAHVTYENEVMAGETIEVQTRVLDLDDKRMHVFHRMVRPSDPAVTVATNELMILYVDMNTRRTAAMPVEVRARLEALHAIRRRPR
jgi:acyl-CoA thioester hydrolase